MDEPSLERLRDRCAEVFRAALPRPARDSDPSRMREALLAGLRFRAFDEVPAVLRALRAQGARLVVVSNWDVSLHDVLRDTALADLVDGVLTSAEERISKPDARIFERGAAARGRRAPQEAWHVGDDLDADVGGRAGGGHHAGARRPRRVGGPRCRGSRTVRTLAELLPGGR